MNSRPPVNLDITVEFITPEMAVEYLKHNTFNRRLSEPLVNTYTDVILNDEWTLNGETIIFGQRGVLQSGQHRLHAIIKANKGIWTVVVRGAKPEGVYTLDAGRKRRLIDALNLRGEKDTSTLATAITWMWRYQVGAMDRRGETATNSHLLKIFDATPELRDCLTQGRRLGGKLKFSMGLCTALYHVFSEIDLQNADSFVQKIHSGENLKLGDPIHTLLRWSHNAHSGVRRPTTTVVAAIIIKAWNGYREIRVVKNLSYRPDETFPGAV